MLLELEVLVWDIFSHKPHKEDAFTSTINAKCFGWKICWGLLLNFYIWLYFLWYFWKLSKKDCPSVTNLSPFWHYLDQIVTMFCWYFRKVSIRHRTDPLDTWLIPVSLCAGVRADAEKHIREICAAKITRFKSDKLRAINRSSLSELFISFLAKVINHIMML